MTPRPLVVLTVLVLIAAPASADVIVINPAGGDGSALLQSALDTAQNGDTILVRPGTYGPVALPLGAFHTPDRTLTLAVDAGAPIELYGLTIANLSAGHDVVVRGFKLGAAQSFASTRVENCAGNVRLEDCTGVGHKGYSVPDGFGGGTSFDGLAGLVVIDAPNVVIERCSFTGGAGEDTTVLGVTLDTDGGPGARVHDARLVVADSTLTGGAGGFDSFGFFPADGGAGLLVEDGGGGSHVFALGSACTGGAGGSSVFATGGNGGDALVCLEADAAVWLRGSTLLGGAAGTGSPPGTAGAMISSAAPVTSFAEPWGSVSVPAPLRQGTIKSLTFTGAPGDGVFVMLAPGAGLLPLAGRSGPLLVSLTGFLGPVAGGTLNAGGSLNVPFFVPTLPAGLQNLTFPVQAAVSHDGKLTVGGVTHFVWIKS